MIDPAEVDQLREAAEALIAHTSRTEIRKRNQLEADFRRLATPERVLALIERMDELDDAQTDADWRNMAVTSLSDRELLECAAKVSGRSVKWCKARERMELWHDNGGAGVFQGAWNPRDDSGDSQCLAVDMSFQVKPCESGVDICDEHGNDLWSEQLNPNGCHYAMTRLAILRAAAEVWLQKQQ